MMAEEAYFEVNRVAISTVCSNSVLILGWQKEGHQCRPGQGRAAKAAICRVTLDF